MIRVVHPGFGSQIRIRKTGLQGLVRVGIFSFRVADPHHLNADPDLAFYLNEDQNPAPHRSNGNLRPLVNRPSKAPFQASIRLALT